MLKMLYAGIEYAKETDNEVILLSSTAVRILYFDAQFVLFNYFVRVVIFHF